MQETGSESDGSGRSGSDSGLPSRRTPAGGGEIARAVQRYQRRHDLHRHDADTGPGSGHDEVDVAALAGATDDAVDGGRWGGGAPGFGVRAERLMRQAEQEAAEIRRAASAEAVAVLAEVREEADAARGRVASELSQRRQEVDRLEADQRERLDAQEREAARGVATAEQRAGAIESAARDRAAAICGEAEEQARAMLEAAEQSVTERREQAERELDALAERHRSALEQLRSLHAVLGGALSGPRRAPTGPPRRGDQRRARETTAAAAPSEDAGPSADAADGEAGRAGPGEHQPCNDELWSGIAAVLDDPGVAAATAHVSPTARAGPMPAGPEESVVVL